MKSNLSLLFFILVVVLIRWSFVGSIHWERNSPIEIDDAYSYLMKPEMIYQDPHYEKPTLRSFENFGYPPKLVTMPDVYQMRINHRINHHYHLGHSIVLLAVKKMSGIDYQQLWWLLVYLLNFLLVAFSIYFVYKTFGTEVAHIALLFSGLSFVLVNHQFTAAPREWSNVGAFGLLILVWKMLKEPKESSAIKALNWAWLTFAFWFCLSAHDVGKAIFLQISIVALVSIALAEFNANRWHLFFRMGSASLAAYILQKLLLSHFQPDRGKSSMSTFSVSWNYSELFWSISNSLANPIIMIKKIPIFSNVLGLFFLLGGLIYLGRAAWKKRGKAEVFGFFLVSSTIAIQILFHFVGYPYLDDKILFLESYYFTFSYTIFSFAYAYCIYSFLGSLNISRFRNFIPLACWILFVAPLPLRWDSLKQLRQSFVTQNNWVDGSRIAEKIDAAANGNCVYMEGEVALSIYLMYGKLITPVSYNGYCREPSKFLNRPEWNCKFVFMGNSNEPCRKDLELEVIDQNENYIFARVKKLSSTSPNSKNNLSRTAP